MSFVNHWPAPGQRTTSPRSDPQFYHSCPLADSFSPPTFCSYHCLFCHGFEEKGVPSAGVLAVGDIANPQMALHLARMAKRLTGKVTVYTDGATSLAEQLDGMAVDGEVVVERRAIARLEKSSHGTDVIVHFKDGEKVTEGFLVKDTPLLALEV